MKLAARDALWMRLAGCALAMLAALGGGCSCATGDGRDVDAGPLDGGDDVVLLSSTYGYCNPDGNPFGAAFRCATATDQCIPTQDIPIALCTVPCTSDADCPPALGQTGACVPFGIDDAMICVLRCQYMHAGQCFSGQSCNLRYMMRLCY